MYLQLQRLVNEVIVDWLFMQALRAVAHVRLNRAQWAESLQTFKSENWNSTYLKNHNILLKYT